MKENVWETFCGPNRGKYKSKGTNASIKARQSQMLTKINSRTGQNILLKKKDFVTNRLAIKKAQ